MYIHDMTMVSATFMISSMPRLTPPMSHSAATVAMPTANASTPSKAALPSTLPVNS
ncbi:MAG: hypothetical protein R2844_09625 [Caldilineales bacterium]